MELVRVLTTINLQHLLKIKLEPDSTSLSASDSDTPELPDDQELSPSSIRNQYIFRPTSNNRINFNPKLPKDVSKIYAGNPFLNNLATTNPTAAANDDSDVLVQYVNVNQQQDRPVGLVDTFGPTQYSPVAQTQAPISRGGKSSGS